MLGQPLFPPTGKLDRMPSHPVHPFPTLWFTRIPLCFRSREAVILVNRNARSAAVLSRTSIPHTFGPVPLSLSLSLSVFVFLSLAFWWVSRLLTDCIYFYIVFYFFHFFISFFFYNDSGSVSCARSDSFVMHSASSGTPGSHTPAGRFPG